MSFTHKIDEWMKEAEARPESAVTIVKLIARRLRELTERNEELLAENIALQNGTRVEEYRQRIAHLEYQLELLKRRFGTEEPAPSDPSAGPDETSAVNLLIYDSYGRILRMEAGTEASSLGHITDDMLKDGEPPRLLAVSPDEEVLLLFTSGRISTHAVSSLPAAEIGGAWSWGQAALPDEPRAGEWLACIAPLSELPLSDLFVQVSRRGCVKKTMTSLAQSILSNRFLGRGTLQQSDQPFEAALCGKNGILAFVTFEGHLLGLDVDELSYSAEERIRLTASDYVVGSFLPGPGQSLLFVTQTGKVIQCELDSLELAKSPSARGQALIPPSRLEQGVRFVGGAAVRDTDRVAVLDAAGNLRVHSAGELAGAGAIEAGGLILSIGAIPADEAQRGAR